MVRFQVLRKEENMRRAGIEPALPPWQGGVLPLDYPRVRTPIQNMSPGYLFFLGLDLLEVRAPALRAEPGGRLHEYGLALPSALLALELGHIIPYIQQYVLLFILPS